LRRERRAASKRLDCRDRDGRVLERIGRFVRWRLDRRRFDMRHSTPKRGTFPASESERASIRALKNWLLATPGESPFADQIVRLRIAAAIAAVSSAALERGAAGS
jgi:hypothetical protein